MQKIDYGKIWGTLYIACNYSILSARYFGDRARYIATRARYFRGTQLQSLILFTKISPKFQRNSPALNNS